MHENLEFIQAFFKNPLHVGAIAPSSQDLAKKMLEGIRPNKDSVVLELGPGTGSFTKPLSKLVSDNESYLGIEVDVSLVLCLQKKFPKMQFIRGNACKTFALHRRSKLGKVDYIISGLPFVSMPKTVNARIIAEIERFMEKGCLFRTFQYAHTYYLPPAVKLREVMRDRYGKPKKSQLVVKNVPPAFTLTWQTS